MNTSNPDMKFVSSRLLRVALLSCAALLPAAAWAGDKTAEATDQSAEGGSVAQSAQKTLETVTVTARHKKEDAGKVPIAISVVDEVQLEQKGLFSLSQITSIVPSLQIQGHNPRNQTVAIRGLGANPGLTTEGFEPGVGIYVDNVYYARPATVLFDLFDLDHVEVVRGPQGTLFGKNTTAGALSATTKAPSSTWGANAAISYGDYNFKQLNGTVTGPVVDDIAFRLTLGDTTRDDAIKTTNPNVRNNGLHNQSARLQFLYTPTSDLSFRLIADYNHQNFTGPHAIVLSALPRTLANGSTTKNWFDRLSDAGYTPPAGIGTDPKSRRSDINSPNYWNQDTHGVSLQGDWTLSGVPLLAGDTITSITAWREFELFPAYDSDYGGLEYYKSLYIHIKQSQYSQELRITSGSNDTLDYTAGIYLFWQKSPVDSHSIYGSGAAQFSYGATTSPLLLNGLDAHSVFDFWDGSYSAYGQATWHIDDDWSVLGGVRYTYEDKYGFNHSSPDGTYAAISALPTAQQATAASRRASIAPTYNYTTRWAGGEISGTASVNYQISRDILAYATYSRGFQSAGLNVTGVPDTTPKIVDPEHVNSYEVGAKSTLFGDRLTLNADLFWSDIDNFQATIADTVLGASRTYIANGGDVRSRGVEVDASAVPIDGLTVSASLVYDDAIYTSLASTPCAYLYSYLSSCNLSGKRLAGVSAWSGSFSAEYARSVGGNLEAYVGGDWTGRSSFYSQLNDDIFSKVAGYGLVGLHLGLRNLNQNWDISFWARNVFNQYYANVLSPSKSSGYVMSAVGDPRYVGATLRWKLNSN